MAQHLNVKLGLSAGICLAVLGLSIISALSPDAEARTPAPQMTPVISLDTPLARDMDTFENDKSLDAACRKTGQDKAVCLCVTHIMKYELTLAEYRAATRLYGQDGDRADVRQTLLSEGFAKSDINMAEQMEQSLTEDKDFALRCGEAKAYYKNAAK